MPLASFGMSSALRVPADVELALARWALGLLLPDDLPGVSVSLLLAGIETPDLVLLAGEVAPDPREARDRFERALDATGLRVGRTAARVIVTRHTCTEIVARRLDGYDGAQVVNWQVALDCPRDDPNASHYYDFWGIDDPKYDADLAMALARQFLRRFPCV